MTYPCVRRRVRGTFRAMPGTRYRNDGDQRHAARITRGEPEECWLWTGTVNGNGYGQLSIAKRTVLAHVKAYTDAHGPVPTGMQVCHTCDERLCCNPAHLWAGSPAQNQYDKGAKGRAAKGTANAAAKLNDDAVRHIRERLARGDLHREIAATYGVSRPIIDRIANGKAWTHVV